MKTIMSITKEENRRFLAEVIRLFVKKEKHARFMEFLDLPKRYGDLIDGIFIDPRNLDPECLIETNKTEKSVEGLLTSIEKLGGGKQAFLISEIDDSGKCLGLEEALEFVVASGNASLIYCIGTPVGYYTNDDGIRLILYRDSNK